MTQTIEIGKINKLLIDRITPPGIFLRDLDGKDVLLPNRYVTPQMQIFDTLDVFIYTDSEDRIVATTETPKAYADEFGVFKVVGVSNFGAFVDIGLQKDILVPKNRQKSQFEIGDTKILRILVDEKSGRLTGDERLGKYFEEPTSLEVGQPVDLIVYAKSPLGFKVIINKKYEGLIFANEVFGQIKTADKLNGFVKNITKEGKIDIALQPNKGAKKDFASQKVLEMFEKNNSDTLPFTYKSDADNIGNFFGISKKAFKAALTLLIESKEIILEEKQIRKV